MAHLRNLFALGSIAALGALAVGCSSEAPNGGAAEDTSDDALLTSSCESEAPRRYDAMLANGVDCANVPADTGTWLGRPLFADAPEEVKSKSCRYTWRARHSGGAPDRDSLDAATSGSRLVSTCARGKPPTIRAEEDDRPPSILPQGGSVGCDVCGIIREGKIWLVPPRDYDRIHLMPQLLKADS